MKLLKLLIIGVLSLSGFAVARAEENVFAAEGCFVERVENGSPAETAGLKAGDIIVTASSVSIRSAEDLRTAVGATSGDMLFVVRRGTHTENVAAHLEPPKARGYRLGVLCGENPAQNDSGDVTSGAQPRVYVGLAFSRLSLGGDFDGDHVLYSPLTQRAAAVPSFDDTVGFGGILGFQAPLPRSNIDIAIEVSYQQGSMKNYLGGAANDDKAVLREVKFTGKSYFFTHRSFQPFLGIGMNIPWLEIPDGVIEPTFRTETATFRGIGWHGGGGLCFYILRQLSVEAFLAYQSRHFNSLNGEEIDNSLLSASFEPSLSIRYHFSMGAPKKKADTTPPKV